MKSAVICVLLLTLLYGNVSAGISFEEKIETNSEQTEESDLRIVNGTETRIEQFPYIVHLRGSSTCGASIITYYHAFTAAHCVYERRDGKKPIALYGGSTSKSRANIEFDVDQVVIHPKYNHSNHAYDAAILHVSNTFRGYKNIEPIPLQDTEVPPVTGCYAAGWGLNDYDLGTSLDNLQYAVLKVLPAGECLDRWPFTISIICAQPQHGVDMCRGDSGGPLVCDDKLTGAYSYGFGACRGEGPSVFTKVMDPDIREFIRTNAGI